jgi:hypothetical protein
LQAEDKSWIIILVVALAVTIILLNINSKTDMPTDPSDIVGFAAHPLSVVFSAATPGFSLSANNVLVSDTAIYRTGWYSINGTAWRSFNLTGNSYSTNSNWLKNSATRSLPTLGIGEHYIIIYSCSYINNTRSWDCHDNRWQLLVINNTIPLSNNSTNTTNSTPLTCSGSNTRSCNISNGMGIQFRTCNNGVWTAYGTCTVTSCNSGYVISGNSCVIQTSTSCPAGEYLSNGVCLLSVPGNTYFVALNGNDSWPGNFTHPFYSWNKGAQVVQAGDIVYIRGGVWMPTTHIMTSGGYNTGGVAFGLGRSGTAQNPIRIFNYPGEKPIMDGSLLQPNQNRWMSGIGISNAQYIHLKGLTIRHIHQSPPDHNPATNAGKNYSEVYGVGSDGSANLIFENMVVHDIDGRGFQHWSGAWPIEEGPGSTFNSDNTSWINCDAYNLFDRYSAAPGNAADGWKVGGSYGNYFLWEGCRAWNYSDDGFDPHGQSYRIFRNCWAMSGNSYDGLSELWTPEGNGFKMTGVNRDTVRDYSLNGENFVIMENCIAAYTVGVGFYNNILVNYETDWPNNGLFYNNLAYRTEGGFFDGGANVGGTRTTIYRNNIAFGSTYNGNGMTPLYEVGIYNPAVYPHSHNTWRAHPTESWPGWEYNPAFTVTDTDFVSVDASQLTRPRKSDGSLPDITFGHLREGSDLIDGGTIIPGYHCPTAGAHPGSNCRVWYGAAPDLGPFESNYGSDGVSGGGSQSVVSCSGSSTRSCNITNGVGIQSMTCNTTTGIWGAPYSVCNVTSCNNNYFINSSVCSYAICSGSNNRSCNISNGNGIQFRTCNNGSWSVYNSCSIVSCNSGYVQSGNTCILSVPSLPSTNTGGAIIADHTSADAFDIIPQCWIERAKDQFVIGYGHTSHGSQISSGLWALNTLMNAVNGVPTNLYLVNNGGSGGALDMEEGSGYDASGWLAYDVGYSGWDTRTRAYLNSSLHSDVNTIMWSWCGQVGGYTTYSTMSAHYLTPAESIASTYGINFIYMTGHLDGGGPTGSVYTANNIIRQHVRNINGTLFDFADIESYAPNGSYYPSESDTCNWCTTWCNTYTQECAPIFSAVSYCAHSHDYNCYRKAKAFWWMVARMAGWNGSASHTCT